jgi:hypothetical protein
MISVSNILPVILLLIEVSACAQSKNDFLGKYGGDPYMGTVKVYIVKPDGTTGKTDRGEANAYFSEKGKGKAQMVLFGAIKDKKGDAGFVVDGPYQGSTWKTDGREVEIAVDANGKFSGGGELKTQKFAFSGTITGGFIDLTLRITEKNETKGGYPAGSTFVFTYSLSRANKDAKKKCKKIVWQTRYIGHFDGSGSTIRVPVCMD